MKLFSTMRFVVLILVFSLLSCNSEETKSSSLKLALNWFPETEHGGFYAAQVHDYFKKENLEVEILAGGPDAPVIQRVATGEVQFGVTNADDVLNAQAQKAPVVAVFATYQTNPRCIMVHAKSGINTIEEIKNITLALSQRPAFSHYLQKKFPLTGVKMVPYPGNISQFLADPNFAQQGYIFSEPFIARKKGSDPKTLMISEIGFNPYASVLITTEQFIAQHPEQVAALVKASVAGWEHYLREPEPTNQHIHKLNPEMDLEVLAYGATESKSLIMDGKNPVGHMSAERWQTLLKQMEEIELIQPQIVDIQKVFTTQFLPKGSPG